MTEQVTAAGFRLAPQQEVLWEAEPEGPRATVQTAIALGTRLDDEHLRGALQRIVERHEILRTTFRRQPGMSLPLQVVAGQGSFEWHSDGLGAKTTFDERVRAERSRQWPYEEGPLLRAALLSRKDDSAVLVLTAPAVSVDESSMRVLAHELTLLVAGAETEGEPLQYADFAEWQAQVLEQDDAARPADGAPVRVPFTRPEPESSPSFEPERLQITLADDAARRLRSGTGDSAPADLFFACLGVTACRLAGVSEATVGRVLDGRHLVELEGAVGSLAKIAPLTVRTDAERFSKLVESVAVAAAGAVDGWESLPPRPLSAGPAVVGEWLDWRSPVQAGGVVFVEPAVSSTLGGYRLKVVASAADATEPLELLFDEALVPRDAAERFAAAFAQVLSSVLTEPEINVDAIDAVSPAERKTIAISWNETARPLAYNCIHHRFEEQVERTPDRIASRDGDNELTYAELNERANRVAHRLRALGVGQDVVVGLCMDRSVDMVAALLGILKAGGAYLPLHSEHPPARLVRLLEEAKAPVLVTQEQLRNRFTSFGRETLRIDRGLASLSSEDGSNLDHVNEPDDCAYVMFTSGSTGTPKGVAVTHRGLANYAAFIVETLGAEESEGLTFALVSAISTDLGNTCVFPPLVSGGTLHLIDPAASMDGAELTRIAKERPYDVLKITPSHLTALVATGESALLPRRCLIVGGEASTWDLIERVRANSDCRIINHYGPTETTIGSCTFELTTDVSAYAPATVPIGRPIANTECYILDAGRKLVPVGVPGELYIGGAGVARGYAEQPDETDRRFLPSPFREGGRLYATGDLARYLPDGNIEFLGRADAQVKIRGFRVEPAEVESALLTHRAVREACVTVREDVAGEKRLVAYVVAETETPEELRTHLAAVIPDYMVPSSFVALGSLPRTPSGKIDRLALPEPEAGRATEYLAPSTPVEETIAGIWREVLGVEQVGIRDDFFELGGHSLLATQVVARTRNALGVQIPLNVFFVNPTVSGLAVAVESAGGAAPAEDELARLLDDLESLSDEEAEQLLAAELRSRQDGE